MDNINSDKGLDRLATVPVPMSVRVCQQKMSLGDLLKWTPGTLISFDRSASAGLILCAGHQEVGQGTAVKIGAKIGILVRRVGSVE